MRTLVTWCPDWPLVAAGLDGVPAAVLRANRVVATSAPARREGVRLRQRRREAEAICPGIVIVPEDPVRDLRAFEPVVAAVGELTPLVELTRPGVCSLPVRGPARYFGGEEALACRLRDVVGKVSRQRARIGIADSAFAARLAARHDLIVPAGETAGWLARLPVGVLGPPELVELLERLGLHRVGDFTALDEATVGSRFGSEGVRAHRMGRGFDMEVLSLNDPPPDMTVSRELEEPVDQVDVVAFLAAGLAEELVGRLAPHGLACTRLLVEAATEHGEELSRWWRAEQPFTQRAMVDRVRWQLEGWLSAGPGAPGAPTSGVMSIRLSAGEVIPEEGRQLGIFGEPAEVRQRVGRQVARIQSLLGHEAVGTAVAVGARSPAEQVCFVPFGETREEPASVRHPWPGRLPSPAPAVVYPVRLSVAVLGADGNEVGVTGRGCCTAEPAVVDLGGVGRAGNGDGGGDGGERRHGGGRRSVVGWAGPWPAEERWWDPHTARRRARLQVQLEDGSAHVLVLEGGRWRLEATYD
ncbi:MAG: DNA polymerase Y family protein [Actinomycetota bacterium]|nr:DNA polymerase Y family protein [Actinomycetota bacterium]